MRVPFLLLFLLSISGLRAAEVDTVAIYSKAMRQARKCVVIRPAKKQKEALPVVYLLHGYSGGYADWIRKLPQLKHLVEQYRLLIVCPDGGYSSWYFDAPVDTASRYETYIGTEVPEYIDAHYNTIRDRRARAITGLSMGGHGALYLAFRHADRFGACGSMSGGVDLARSKTKFDIAKRIGDSVNFAANWREYSVVRVIEKKPSDSLAVIFDCGTGDFFLEENRGLHRKMLELNIAHDYIERPGAHNWTYWQQALPYQLLFFRNYFDAGEKERESKRSNG